MKPQQQFRSRYLSLALDARKVVDALVTYVKGADLAKVDNAQIRRAVDSLASARNRERIFSAANRRSLFGDYERMQTLNEVRHVFPADVSKHLKQVLSASLDVRSRRKSAEQAIQFFCALEGRALEKYSQSMDM